MRKIIRLIRRIWHIERPGAQVSIRVRQPLVFAAFVVSLAWYLAAPTPTTVMTTVALGGMLLFGFLWVRALAMRLEAGRHLRYAALQVGEELEEEISLENGTRAPALWIEFEDHSNIPGYTLSSVRGVDGHGSARWRATTLCTRRGVFSLGPWQIVSGDPFGIFSLRLTYPSREEVLVYPPLAALPPHWLPTGRTVGDHRMLRQPLPAETINLTSTRPYAPGDPLRRIHWRSTARRAEASAARGMSDLQVKVFEPESSSAIWLIPDLDAAAQFTEEDESSLEKLIILTASVASELLGERRAVGLFAVGQAGETVIPPQAGTGHLWTILRGLAPLEATPGQPFSATLEQAARVVSRNSLVIALTSSTQVEWTQVLAGRGLHRRLAGRTYANTGAAAILLLDQLSADLRRDACIDSLAELNLPARTIRAADIHPLSGSYGTLQRWEFITLGTGRAYARRTPRAASSPLGGGR